MENLDDVDVMSTLKMRESSNSVYRERTKTMTNFNSKSL